MDGYSIHVIHFEFRMNMKSMRLGLLQRAAENILVLNQDPLPKTVLRLSPKILHNTWNKPGFSTPVPLLLTLIAMSRLGVTTEQFTKNTSGKNFLSYRMMPETNC